MVLLALDMNIVQTEVGTIYMPQYTVKLNDYCKYELHFEQSIMVLTTLVFFLVKSGTVTKPVKFIGNEKISTRSTDISLKLYPKNDGTGHGYFYLKQVLVDGGSPWWTFYEGQYSHLGHTLDMQ